MSDGEKDEMMSVSFQKVKGQLRAVKEVFEYSIMILMMVKS